jgi:hypothetical protein
MTLKKKKHMEINSLNENNYFLIKYEINLISIYKIHPKG